MCSVIAGHQQQPLTARKLVVLIPIDDEGHFIEEKVLELPEEWLKDLTGIFQRLPDDRYRIYLVMPGNEERRVMDVFVRDGRPFDPSESQPQFVPPAIRSEDLPAASPAVPNDAPPANRAAPVDGRGAAIRAFEAEAADSAAVQRRA